VNGMGKVSFLIQKGFTMKDNSKIVLFLLEEYADAQGTDT